MGVPEDQVIRFDTNTFPWPGAALGDLPDLALNEYPDTSYGVLTTAIADYTGVPDQFITVGAGADELLDLCVKAYVGFDEPVVVSRPTYPMFRILSEMAGGRVVDVPAVQLRLDRDRFLQEARQSRVAWLCNPNNPTGELLPLTYIEDVVRATPGVLVIDEAYFEISGLTAAGLIQESPNVVVVRTLSKAFGLAGARVGYALAGAAITAALRRVRPPQSISVVSAALGVTALRDRARREERVAKIQRALLSLRDQLQELGLETHDSAGNFVLVRIPPGTAANLLKRGLVVRTFPASSPLADFMRVTIRKPEENARLVEALAQDTSRRS
jgi:histidinol-phosphate aminotransferase